MYRIWSQRTGTPAHGNFRESPDAYLGMKLRQDTLRTEAKAFGMQAACQKPSLHFGLAWTKSPRNPGVYFICSQNSRSRWTTPLQRVLHGMFVLRVEERPFSGYSVFHVRSECYNPAFRLPVCLHIPRHMDAQTSHCVRFFTVQESRCTPNKSLLERNRSILKPKPDVTLEGQEPKEEVPAAALRQWLLACNSVNHSLAEHEAWILWLGF